jgi:hypoxanthine phosphoribosyltransferase
MMTEPTVLFNAAALGRRVDALAQQIGQDYPDNAPLTLVGVLNGAVIFLSDLTRQLARPHQLAFVTLSSYGNGTTSSGAVTPVSLNLPDLNGHHVLVVEDIVDTGLSMHFLLGHLSSQYTLKSLKLCALLDKPQRRQHPVQVDYAGFLLEDDAFVVGYGLDYQGFYRNLPFLGVLQAPA